MKLKLCSIEKIDHIVWPENHEEMSEEFMLKAHATQVSPALKAALLSALVFPGCGHLLLKSYLKAALLAATAIACLYLLLSNIVEVAEGISVKIQTGEIPLEVAPITEAISNQLAGGSTQQINVSTFFLLFCWLVGIVDSYRVGRSLQV